MIQCPCNNCFVQCAQCMIYYHSSARNDRNNCSKKFANTEDHFGKRVFACACFFYCFRILFFVALLMCNSVHPHHNTENRMTLASEEVYFEDTEGVIQVFEFDYDSIVDFKLSVEKNNWICCFCIGIPCCPFWHMCEQYNIEDDIRCQHLAVTQDGILYVKERHKAGCRGGGEEKGKVKKTVPFDKITDCDLEEPFGAEGPNCCMMTKRVLTKVNIDTAEKKGNGKHELTLEGLKQSKEFKSLVWKLKREGVDASIPSVTPIPVGEMSRDIPIPIGEMSRDIVHGDVGSNELAPLLSKQNDLISDQNKMLSDLISEQNKLLSAQNVLLEGIKENTAK